MQNTMKTQTKIRAIARYAAAAAILASLACMVNFISASSGTASMDKSRNTLPAVLSQKTLVEKIVMDREFFTRFGGYDGDFLCDVNGELGEKTIGLLLLEPVGFLKSVVFDRDTLKKIREDVSILPKKVRAELANSAVLVSDAKLIAKNIAGLREHTGTNPRQKRSSGETPRREAMPQSLPDGFASGGSRKNIDSEKVLERLRRDIENNPNVTAMTSDEILEHFRSDIQNSPQSRKAGDSR
jgi:hypothetical protein